MGPTEMKQIATWMDRVMSDPSDENAARVAAEVRELTKRFPAPGISVKG
jgi:glycine/serine hydroxymethyltransferase